MAGFKWSLDWDTNPLRRGGQVAADAIENAADVFADLADEADRATERARDSLTDDVKAGGREAERSLSRLEDAFRDTARSAERNSKATGDALGDETRKGTKRAAAATGEFKDEAGANFSEVASSFSGDMDSAVDLVQGTLGGLANTIPGIGIAAGAMAAGIGAIYASLDSSAEKTREQITAMTDDLIESGRRFLTEDYISSELQKIYTNADDATIKMGDLKDLASQTGISEATLARAFAGDQESRTAALQTVIDKYSEAGEQATSTNSVVADTAVEQLGALGRLRDALEDNGDSFTSAQDAQAAYHRASQTEADRDKESVADLNKKYSTLGRTIDGLPNKDLKVTVTLDTTAAEARLRTWRPVVEGVARFGKVVV